MSNSYLKWPPEYDFNGVRVLNAGCGFATYRAPNVVNMDAFDNCKPDVVHDLNVTPYPFKDETFDFILANHVMEHLENFWGAFNEMARCLKVGGRLEVWVPGSGSDSVMGFRDHVREVNHCSFFGTFGTYRASGNAWALANAVCPANRLALKEKQLRLKRKWWLQRTPKAFQAFAVEHLRNVVEEQGFVFVKISEQVHTEEQKKFHERTRAYQSV